MLSTYEKRLFVILAITVFLLQIVYITTNPFDLLLVIGMDLLIFFTVWIFVIDKQTIYEEKPQRDYVGFGTSMNDAIYGTKYRYDLIVDKKNNKNIA